MSTLIVWVGALVLSSVLWLGVVSAGVTVARWLGWLP